METNENSATVKSLMEAFIRKCKSLDKLALIINLLAEKIKDIPKNILAPVYESVEENPVNFFTKLILTVVLIAYSVDLLFITAAADYLSSQYESELAINLIRFGLPALVILVEIFLGASWLKAKELYNETGNIRPLIFSSIPVVFFISVVPLIVGSTILASGDFSTAKLLLYLALLIFSVVSHSLVLIYNREIRESLRYWFNLIFHWIKKGRSTGAEMQNEHIARKYDSKKIEFLNEFRELLMFQQRLKNHGTEWKYQDYLSIETMSLISKFFGNTESGTETAGTVVRPISPTVPKTGGAAQRLAS